MVLSDFDDVWPGATLLFRQHGGPAVVPPDDSCTSDASLQSDDLFFPRPSCGMGCRAGGSSSAHLVLPSRSASPAYPWSDAGSTCAGSAEDGFKKSGYAGEAFGAHFLGTGGAATSSSSIESSETFDVEGGDVALGIKTLSGRRLHLSLGPKALVGELKGLVAEQEGLPMDEIKLVHRGRVLLNGFFIGEYDLSPGTVVYMVPVHL